MEVTRGFQLGRYVLEEPLGKGGQGRVFYARQVNAADGKPCVVKLAKKAAFDEAERDQFLDEARRAMSLGAHPNIVQVLDADVHEGIPFFVMEYSDGTDLDKVFAFHRKRGDTILWDAIYTILKHMADALHYAHFRRKIGGRPIGMIHRDVKPANTLITFDGYAKLLDFGISVFRDDKHTGVHLRGTPRYMSPEHVYSMPCPEMDIYSLGVVAWEMVEGREYRAGMSADMVARANCHSPPPPLRNPEVPTALAELIMTCLAEDKAERPTADEFSKWLETCPNFRLSTESVRVLVTSVMGRQARSRETMWSIEVPQQLRDASPLAPPRVSEPPALTGIAGEPSEDGTTVAWVRTSPDDTPTAQMSGRAEPDAPRLLRKHGAPHSAEASTESTMEATTEVPPTVALRPHWLETSGAHNPGSTRPASPTPPEEHPAERAPTVLVASPLVAEQARGTALDLRQPPEPEPEPEPKPGSGPGSLRRGALLFTLGVLASSALATLAAYLLGAWSE